MAEQPASTPTPSRSVAVLVALTALAPLGFAAIPAGGYFGRVMAGTAAAVVVGGLIPGKASTWLARGMPWLWAVATAAWMAQQ